MLRRVMNTVMRFMAGLGLRDHTSDAQRDHHWLPIKQSICVIMYSVVKGTSPQYYLDMVFKLGGLARPPVHSWRTSKHKNPHGVQSILLPVQQRGTVFLSQFVTFHEPPLLNVSVKLVFFVVPISLLNLFYLSCIRYVVVLFVYSLFNYVCVHVLRWKVPLAIFIL